MAKAIYLKGKKINSSITAIIFVKNIRMKICFMLKVSAKMPRNGYNKVINLVLMYIFLIFTKLNFNCLQNWES